MTDHDKLQYIQCNKNGFHYGQVLNMVCVEASCLQDLVCCCACIEQTHKKHSTKPLKMIMRQAKLHADTITPTKFNTDIILDIIINSQKTTLGLFYNHRKQIMEYLEQVQKSLIAYYSSITEQVKLKNSDPKAQINHAFETIHTTTNIEALKGVVKKLVSMIPNKQQQSIDLSEAQLIESINLTNQQISTTITKSIDQVSKKLSEYNGVLSKNINTKNIWSKTFYKFSNTLKHNDVKLLSQFVVKSSHNSGYKFAIMEPSLQKGSKIKNFTFKIKQSTSNWVAIGMCHQKIVASKNYAFNFNSLGHGGYLISANGGSWSNTKTQANNAVKAFKFGKNDIITCTVNFQTSKITFKKKNEIYDLVFEKIQGDQLHPCALFYYINDQVEALPSYKE